MKKLSIISLIALVAIVVTSCGSSNSVVSNGIISKRKYTKGFFLNRKSNLKTAQNNTKEADLKEDKAIAKAEKVEVRKERRNQRQMTSEKVNTNTIVASTEETTSVESSNYAYEEVYTSGFGTAEDGIVSEQTEAIEFEQETVRQATNTSNAESTSNSGRSAGGSVNIVVLVILALLIPPLAVFLYEGASTRFWIDLILAILGFGIGFGLLGGSGGLLGLIAVIYALLIVLEVI